LTSTFPHSGSIAAMVKLYPLQSMHHIHLEGQWMTNPQTHCVCRVDHSKDTPESWIISTPVSLYGTASGTN